MNVRLTPPPGEQATDKLDGAPQGRLRISHMAVAFIGPEGNSHPKSIQITVIEMFYLGIDVGKKLHVASMLAEGVKKPLFKGFSFANTAEGAKSLLVRISEIAHDTGEVCIGMEATGHYWLALYSFLKTVLTSNTDSFAVFPSPCFHCFCRALSYA